MGEVLDRWQQSAVDHGLRIGQGVTLPVSTRSVTRAEALGRDRRIAFIFLTIGTLIVLGLLAATVQNLSAGQSAPYAMPAYALSAIVCAIGALMMWNRRSSYIDPQIAVEVAEDGITVRDPAREEKIPFAEAAFDVRKYSVDGGAHFVGIVLACRAGTLDMHDLLYRDGKQAAAAILARADAAGRQPNGVY